MDCTVLRYPGTAIQKHFLLHTRCLSQKHTLERTAKLQLALMASEAGNLKVNAV